MTNANSKANTGKQYLLAQFREKDGRAHFQVRCQEVNRGYGFAFNASLDGSAPLTSLKLKGAQTVPSQKGSGKEYVPCQVRARNGKLHVQAAGPKVNRDYGAAVDLVADAGVLEQISSLIGQ